MRFRVAVAYARWDGLGLIAPSLENFLDRGGEVQTIFGVANGVTTPDSLLYSIYLQQLYPRHTYAGIIEDEYTNSAFHTKLYEFQFEDATVSIIGSANLTGGGLLRNTELCTELRANTGDPFLARLDSVWDAFCGVAEIVTVERIRALKEQAELGSERDSRENAAPKQGKPYLRPRVALAPKPLFAKVLDLPNAGTKSNILARMDAITDRPNKLYLQILEGETGAQAAGQPGYQIQLPVATLAAYFGVGTDQTRQVSFRFPGETVTVGLTHFENNTHRVRLRPLRDVPRPGIVVFTRVAEDEYQCAIVPQRNYARTIAEKCTEQTRAGARRWGFR